MLPQLITTVIPAAGVGSRMLADRPKQYLMIHGQTVLEHTVERLLAHPRVGCVVIAVGADDPYFEQLSLASNPRVIRVTGGLERSDSVLNALTYLMQTAPTSWVMVHDAARPCLRSIDLDRLFSAIQPHDIGGILATPVRDTMKRSDAQQKIDHTVERTALWHALTPQLFQFIPLYEALIQARDSGISVTDESSAMEWQGYHPRLVAGHADNIKITQPEDLALATFYLSRNEVDDV